MFLFILGLKYLHRRLRNNLDDFKHKYKICLVHMRTLNAVFECLYEFSFRFQKLWHLIFEYLMFYFDLILLSVPDVRLRELLKVLETYATKHENAQSRDHTRHQLRSSEDNSLEEVSEWNMYGSFPNDLFPFVNLFLYHTQKLYLFTSPEKLQFASWRLVLFTLSVKYHFSNTGHITYKIFLIEINTGKTQSSCQHF